MEIRLSEETEFSIPLPENFRVQTVLGYLGRDPESLTEQVEANQFRIGMRINERPVLVQGTFHPSSLEVRINEPRAAGGVRSQIVRILGLDQEPDSFETFVRSIGHEWLFLGHEGTRIPQTASTFDGLVWSIVGQQVNLKFAGRLRSRLSVLAGDQLDETLWAPPSAKTVSSLNPSDLAPLQFSSRKAEYLIDSARLVANGSLPLDHMSKMPQRDVEAMLLAVRGIGPWSANYVMLRALGMPDCLPLGDTGLTSGLARLFKVDRPGAKETVELMEPFRPYRSLATYHIWRSLSEASQ